ncbi:hypothetical protein YASMINEVIRUS_523 [Yasminevirus sp. GU-2018]|uniref:Uncharacterized protein n=1 Tax=Yasminevirus sp. GU-2018 TaxID=2420051 RepID=A0A5K0U8B5_9VIRU|nr:hypothetical protein YASMINEVIRUS_523 [Yasminevirus sp. GU-2018]
MELSTFDILLLFIFAVAISVVIGANVLYIVDKRLSDIQINVPACPAPVCPKPVCYQPVQPVPTSTGKTTSTHNIQKPKVLTQKGQFDSKKQNKTDKEVERFMDVANDYMQAGVKNTDLTIDRDADHDVQRYTDPSGMYTTNALVTNKVGAYTPSDDVTDVADDYAITSKTVERPLVVVNDSSPAKRPVLRLRQGYMNKDQRVVDNTNKNYVGFDNNINNDNTLISPPNSTTSDPGVLNRTRPGDRITYPSADDIVRYNGYGCYQNIDTKDVRKVKVTKTGEATDVARGYAGSCRPYTDESITEGAVNAVNASFYSPMTNDVTDIRASSIRFHVPKLYMGRDPYISGVSYAKMSIGGPADVDQIGSIPVNDYDGEPVPVGSFVDN